MKTIVSRVFINIFLLMAPIYLFSQSGQEKEWMRNGVDWLWNGAGNNPPTRLSTWTCRVPIGDGSSWSIRGPIGATTCGRYAVLYALAGKRDASLAWLLASQDHNPHIQGIYNQYPNYAIDYAVERYKDDALSSAAWNGVIPYLDLITGITGSHNPASRPPKEDIDRGRDKDIDHGSGKNR